MLRMTVDFSSGRREVRRQQCRLRSAARDDKRKLPARILYAVKIDFTNEDEIQAFS